MMRLPAFLWFLIGFTIAVTSCTVSAETIPATPTETIVSTEQAHWEESNCQDTPGATYYAHTLSQLQSQALPRCLDDIESSHGPGSCPEIGPINQDVPPYFYRYTQTACGKSNINLYASKVTGCLAPATWNGTACVTVEYTCPSGYALEGQSCTRSDCRAGTKVDSGMYTDADGNGITKRACLSGCNADFKGTGPYTTYWVGAQSFENVYVGDYIADGSTCTVSTPTETPVTVPPEETQPVNTPEYDCASKGMTTGTINGTVVCVAPGTPGAPPVNDSGKTVKENSDGTRTEKEVQDKLDGDQVVREETTTEYDAQGNQTGQSVVVTTSSVNNFCEQNPNAALCAKSKLTGGAGCTDAPVCSGDAIQCSIQLQSWKTRCELSKTNQALGEGSQLASELAAVGEAAMDGQPLDKTDLTETLDVSGQISTQKFLSGGCIPDKVVSLPYGQSLTIPFSSLCSYLEIFGNIMVIIAMLAAARIVGVF